MAKAIRSATEVRKMIRTLERWRKKLDKIAQGPINPERPDELVTMSNRLAKLEAEFRSIKFIKS